MRAKPTPKKTLIKFVLPREIVEFLTLRETLLVTQDTRGNHLAMLRQQRLEVRLFEVWRQIGNV